MQVHFGDCGPKVELVSRRTTLETAKRISCQMNRKNATPGGCGAMDRARPTQLVAVSLTSHEADQLENVSHGNRFSNGSEIDTWQEHFSSKRHPATIASGWIENSAQRRGTRRRFSVTQKSIPTACRNSLIQHSLRSCAAHSTH